MKTSPPISIDRLGSLIGSDDRKHIQEVAGLFVKSARKMVRDITAFIDRGHFDAACVAAHGLKGAASNVGADHLAFACLDLERSLRLPSLDDKVMQYLYIVEVLFREVEHFSNRL